MSWLLGCSGASAGLGALAGLGVLAGSGASAGWASSGGLAGAWGLWGGLKSLSHPEEQGVLKLVAPIASLRYG